MCALPDFFKQAEFWNIENDDEDFLTFNWKSKVASDEILFIIAQFSTLTILSFINQSIPYTGWNRNHWLILKCNKKREKLFVK